MNSTYIGQECEKYLECEPHTIRYICGQRENYLLINMFIYSLLQIKNMDILTEIEELCPVVWNIMAFLFERES